MGVAYDADLVVARAAIVRVIEGLPDVEHDRGYDIFVKELGDSSVNFAVRFMAQNEFFWPAFKLFWERLKVEFDAVGVGIPFPQMDVHVKGEDSAAEER